MRRGFTMIELLVVLAIIAVLVAAVSTSVNAARRRAMITRAQSEAEEITNAILAYANYTQDGTLGELAGRLSYTEANESTLGFLIGKGSQNGQKVPILYNAASTKGSGAFLDPWGRPYRVTVKRGQSINPPGVPQMNIRLFYPNWHRLEEGE